VSGYAAILVYLVVSLLVGIAVSSISAQLGPRAPGGLKRVTYESGIIPERPVSHFSVRFYRVAMLFLVFDVGVMALYPWATNVASFQQAGFDKALAFLVIVGMAFAYVWRRGGFTWD
jgi:NADH-quinone oxidoreductase subunit A